MEFSLFQELVQSFSHYGLVIVCLEMSRRIFGFGMALSKNLQNGEVIFIFYFLLQFYFKWNSNSDTRHKIWMKNKIWAINLLRLKINILKMPIHQNVRTDNEWSHFPLFFLKKFLILRLPLPMGLIMYRAQIHSCCFRRRVAEFQTISSAIFWTTPTSGKSPRPSSSCYWCTSSSEQNFSFQIAIRY